MLLQPQGLGGEYFEALAGGEGDAAVVPVEGDVINDLYVFGAVVFARRFKHINIFVKCCNINHLEGERAGKMAGTVAQLVERLFRI